MAIGPALLPILEPIDGDLQTITAMDTNLAVATDHFVINNAVGTLTNPADFAEVRALVALALKDNPNDSTFSVAIYDAGRAC